MWPNRFARDHHATQARSTILASRPVRVQASAWSPREPTRCPHPSPSPHRFGREAKSAPQRQLHGVWFERHRRFAGRGGEPCARVSAALWAQQRLGVQQRHGNRAQRWQQFAFAIMGVANLTRVAASPVACFRGLPRCGGTWRHRTPPSSWGGPRLACPSVRPLLPAGKVSTHATQ